MNQCSVLVIEVLFAEAIPERGAGIELRRATPTSPGAVTVSGRSSIDVDAAVGFTKTERSAKRSASPT
jgi:hypothetical protein